MEDLASFDEDLSDCLYKLPTENLPLVSLQRTRGGHDARRAPRSTEVSHCSHMFPGWFVCSWKKPLRRSLTK